MQNDKQKKEPCSSPSIFYAQSLPDVSSSRVAEMSSFSLFLGLYICALLNTAEYVRSKRPFNLAVLPNGACHCVLSNIARPSSSKLALRLGLWIFHRVSYLARHGRSWGRAVLAFDLLKHLQHLATSAQGIDASVLEGLVVKLDEIGPLHVLQVVRVLV